MQLSDIAVSIIYICTLLGMIHTNTANFKRRDSEISGLLPVAADS